MKPAKNPALEQAARDATPSRWHQPAKPAARDYSDDAWKRHRDLIDHFTRDWEVSHNLRVWALACERNVRLDLIELLPGERPPKDKAFHSTQRNVSTMRELAAALIAACDFVEAANPEWAKDLG